MDAEEAHEAAEDKRHETLKEAMVIRRKMEEIKQAARREKLRERCVDKAIKCASLSGNPSNLDIMIETAETLYDWIIEKPGEQADPAWTQRLDGLEEEVSDLKARLGLRDDEVPL